MEGWLIFLLALAVAGGATYWIKSRGPKRVGVPGGPPPQPGPTPPVDWNKVWCDAVKKGMPNTPEAGAGIIAAARQSNPNWNPPTSCP